MAVPDSGELTMHGLHKEKAHDNYGAATAPPVYISMYDLVNGGNASGSAEDYDVTNARSSNYPNTAEPHQMSEWYRYDHDT